MPALQGDVREERAARRPGASDRPRPEGAPSTRNRCEIDLVDVAGGDVPEGDLDHAAVGFPRKWTPIEARRRASPAIARRARPPARATTGRRAPHAPARRRGPPRRAPSRRTPLARRAAPRPDRVVVRATGRGAPIPGGRARDSSGAVAEIVRDHPGEPVRSGFPARPVSAGRGQAAASASSGTPGSAIRSRPRRGCAPAIGHFEAPGGSNARNVQSEDSPGAPALSKKTVCGSIRRRRARGAARDLRGAAEGPRARRPAAPPRAGAISVAIVHRLREAVLRGNDGSARSPRARRNPRALRRPPLRPPRIESLRRPRPRVVVGIGFVVAAVVALHGGGVRAPALPREPPPPAGTTTRLGSLGSVRLTISSTVTITARARRVGRDP